MSVNQIVYTSRSGDLFDSGSLTELLSHAREKNKVNDITGALLHSPGRFIQCIEGRAESIDGLYARIQRDSRHRDICLLQDLTLPSRFFSDWTMGSVAITQSEYLQVSTAEWELVADTKTDGWFSPGFVLLKALWDQYKATASKAAL